MNRVYKGLIAGMVGAVFMHIINLAFYYLNIVEIRFIDWGGFVFLGRVPHTLAESIYGLIIHLFWTGLMGVFLSYLLSDVNSRFSLVIGALYAFFITFVFRVVLILYKIPIFSEVSVTTNLLNTAVAFIWGLLAGEVFFRLNTRSKL